MPGEVIIAAAAVLFVGCGILAGLWYREHCKIAITIRNATDALKIELGERFENDRVRSLKAQRAVLIGFFFERFGLFDGEFPYNTLDVYPVPHSPIDFIAFKGLDESDGDICESVDLLEFKSGRKQLSRREQSICNCVVDGRVSYRIVTSNKDGNPSVKTVTEKSKTREERAFKPYEPVVHEVTDEEFDEIMNEPYDPSFASGIKLPWWDNVIITVKRKLGFFKDED